MGIRAYVGHFGSTDNWRVAVSWKTVGGDSREPRSLQAAISLLSQVLFIEPWGSPVILRKLSPQFGAHCLVYAGVDS